MEIIKKNYCKKSLITSFIILFIFLTITVRANVHTTYLWHLQQPIYWPEQSQWNQYTYQKVWESYTLKQNGQNQYDDGLSHPLNDLADIFDKEDRKAVYQYRIRNAVQSLLGLPEAGAQTNYSGCLIENVNSLANADAWGYNLNWEADFIEARNWTTNGGQPRLDMVGFTMHHALSPLLDERAFRKQIQAHRYIYSLTFGEEPEYSKGFWPAECAFSEKMIKVLSEEGFEWCVVANSHLARTLADYPLEYGTSGCNIDPPNQADKVDTNGNNWWEGQLDGRGGKFAAPYCYQPHKAVYIDPETSEEYKITVVPMGDLLSYMNGFAMMDTDEIDNYIAPYDDEQHPSLVLMAHDGDNAWGGGFSYYSESVSQFANLAAANGYSPTTIQQYLADHPVPEDDVVRVESGAWVNAANDWGHPQFINWLWPMYNTNYDFDENGWTEDARNWAVIIAAQNRVETAEDLTPNTLEIGDIVYPDASSQRAERAWHHLLPAYTSGYMYYGTAIDMEVKPSLACNLACEQADMVIEDNPGEDNTPPTLFIPQRFPYNPGSEGFGPIYGYQTHNNDSDFHIWTFAYDVSGLQNVTLKYRTDYDGENPLSSSENETYAGGTGVSGWNSLPMNERIFPIDNYTNNPNIYFFILPDYISNEYYAEISGLQDTLVDYFVEAVDNAGNVCKTPIQHVYVGDNANSDNDDYVSWLPENPESGETLTIFYGEEGFLYDSEELYIHLGINGWSSTDDYPMVFSDSLWQFEYEIPTNAQAIDFVFTDMNGNWDNNNGADWHIEVENSYTNPFEMDGELDETAVEAAVNDSLNIWLQKSDNYLYLATQAITGSEDVFMLISEELTNTVAAPWEKAGTVAEWQLFLGDEGENTFADWFDTDGITYAASGNVLEGVIDVNSCLQQSETIYIAVGVYQTDSNGSLVMQCPEGNGDNNIDFSEYFEADLENWVANHDNELNAAEVDLITYPNPVRLQTNSKAAVTFLINLKPHQTADVNLNIYNLKGQHVKTIFTGKTLSRGLFKFNWDGYDKYAKKVAAGIYFTCLQQNNKILELKKIVVVK